ncbi:MAG: hypothetical protein ACXVXS_05375 [Blastococcus sp.]
MAVADTHTGGPETFDDRTGLRPPGPPSATGRDRRGALRGALLVAAAFLALLLIGSPLAPDRPQPPQPSTVTADVLGRPTRGSLAGDPAFVDAVRRVPWDDPGVTGAAAPPISARHVVFAGDVPGGRWALVVAAQPTAGPYDRAAPLGGAWLTGPPGATPGRMTAHWIPHDLAASVPVALLAARTGALVVVAAPGDVVTVSDRPDVAAGGAVSRAYRRAAAPDGVAVVPLPPSELPYSTATSFQVFRNGAPLLATPPELLADPGPAPPISIDYPRGAPPVSGRQVAEAAAQQILGRLGLPRAGLEVTALWVGTVPRLGPPAGVAAIVAVTVPSGAVVLAAEWQDVDYVRATPCGQAVQPAGTPAARRVAAFACDPTGGTTAPLHTSLVVVGPPDVVRVRVYTGDGTVLAEAAAVAGVAVLPLPVGTDAVEAFPRGGSGLGRVGLLDRTADLGD